MAIERRGSVVIQKAGTVPSGVPLGTGSSPWSGVPGAAPAFLEERAAYRAKEIAMKQDNPIKMKALTRQEGPDGRRLDVDAEFEVDSEQHALTLVEKGLAERLSPAPSPAAEGDTEGDDSSEASEKEWLMQMEPQPYLDKYGPDAKHSAAARAELARRSAKLPASE
jgi:hypothetical protein